MIAKNGDTVLVHYTGRLDSGEEFDSSRGLDPLEFTLGSGAVIPGFEQAVDGLEKGKSVTVRIEPADAYGDHSEELLIAVPKSDLPDEIAPEIGLQLVLYTEQGPMEVEVCEIKEDEVILDANHPLAGEALTFEIELVDILDGPTEKNACSASDCGSCGCGCCD
ncbi:MAG: peptidylprolyl isomerase [Desulfovibrionaceae bacterium]|nr:peptidylprolyl isomerase [Desulfovibrionaceae bacterium]